MAIRFWQEGDFQLGEEKEYSDWITRVIRSEDYSVGEISFIFSDDVYLSNINLQYLDHDTLTDVITFDYCSGDEVSGDVFISTERVAENAKAYAVPFEQELQRVMCHGVLHLMGYNDKKESEQSEMRLKEDEKLKLFHVEH